MEIKSNEEWTNCIEKAVAGDKEALERIVLNLQDMVFNLSLRMLGTFPDAEDAARSGGRARLPPGCSASRPIT